VGDTLHSVRVAAGIPLSERRGNYSSSCDVSSPTPSSLSSSSRSSFLLKSNYLTSHRLPRPIADMRLFHHRHSSISDSHDDALTTDEKRLGTLVSDRKLMSQVQVSSTLHSASHPFTFPMVGEIESCLTLAGVPFGLPMTRSSALSM